MTDPPLDRGADHVAIDDESVFELAEIPLGCSGTVGGPITETELSPAFGT